MTFSPTLPTILSNTVLWTVIGVLIAALLLHVGIMFLRNRTLQNYRRLLYEDELTGLKRSIFLEQRFSDVLAEIDADVSFYYIDIDNFKNYNDLFGHHIANRLLKTFADRLKELSEPFGRVYRIHSDRFLIVHPTPENDEDRFGKELLKTAKAPFEIEGHEIKVTVSVGRYDIPPEKPRYHSSLFRSELALQEAKSLGKDQLASYTNRLKRQSKESFELFRIIKDALKKERFYLEFQPIVSVTEKKLKGLESLIRIHDKHRLHFPLDIIGYAERYNMIEEIDRYVVKRSLEAFKKFKSADVPFEFLSLNISVKEIHNPSFIDFLTEETAKHDIDSAAIVIEFTETTDPRGMEAEARFIERLRAQGFKVAIDDFGTGYSSLVRLSQNILDRIKVDKVFIHDIARKKRNRSLLESIVKLAENFQLEVIVEGVEKERDYEVVKRFGIQYAQGYYFHKPMRIGEIIDMFANK